MFAVSAGDRKHIFWGISLRHLSTSSPIRVSNPGLSVRNISSFLGQEPQPRPSVEPNRLDLIPTEKIVDRRILLLAADQNGRVPEDPKVIKDRIERWLSFNKEARISVDISSWENEDLRILAAVANAPTDQEISDLALIDAFFGPQQKYYGFQPNEPTGLDVLTDLACGSIDARNVEKGGTFRGTLPWMSAQEGYGFRNVRRPPLAGNAFFCTPVTSKAIPSNIPFMLFQKGQGGAKAYFEINPADEWGEIRRATKNAVVLMGILATYPFPSPISAMPGVWYQFAQKELQTIVHMEGDLTPEVARFAVTLAILMHYESASNRIIHLLKKKAKKKRRNAIIRAVGLTAISLVFAAALPAAVATGFQGVQTAIDVYQAREAAKDMVKAAKQFEATDAAFAEEVKKASAVLDAWAALEAEREPLSEEEAQALEEDPEGYSDVTPEVLGGVQPAPDPEAEFPTTELLVGGGAAAGIAAVLLAIMR